MDVTQWLDDLLTPRGADRGSSMSTTPLTSKRLEEIKARADAATPGPWEFEPQEVEEDDEPCTGAWVPKACPFTYGDGLYYMDDANAEFVANARQDVPDLLAEVERLKSQYDELVDALCRKSWAPRNEHARVVALAKIMKARELEVVEND